MGLLFLRAGAVEFAGQEGDTLVFGLGMVLNSLFSLRLIGLRFGGGGVARIGVLVEIVRANRVELSYSPVW